MIYSNILIGKENVNFVVLEKGVLAKDCNTSYFKNEFIESLTAGRDKTKQTAFFKLKK